MPTQPLDRLAAALSGRYRVVRPLGSGATATVYLADDLKHGRQVALKVLKPELAAIVGPERFLREIEIAAKLTHPQILPLYDSASADGFLYYVMPYVGGESLRQRLNREKQLPIDDAVRITCDVAAALDYAHRQGVIHRDIKPENILLFEGRALVADFGLALAVKLAAGDRLTGTGLSVGTPEYMSPEQATADRQLDGRSDIYSLGAVLYEMLAGEPPHTGGTAQAVIAKILTDQPRRLRSIRPTISAELEALVLRALEKVPGDRFQTAGSLIQALETTTHTARSPRRRALVGGLAAAAVLVAVVIGFAVRGRLNRAPSSPEDRQVTFTGDAWGARLSPDGDLVSYLTLDPPSVAVHDLTSGATAILLRTATAPSPPLWSRDGASLLVRAEIDSVSGIFTIPRLGGEPRLLAPLPRLTPYVGTREPALLDLMPDGRYVISSGRWLYVGRDPATIHWIGADSIAADGIVLRVPRGNIAGARVSPDGRWLAYIAVADSTPALVRKLGVVALDGSQSLDLVEGPVLSSPRWTGDGAALYYIERPTIGLGNVMKIRVSLRTGARTSRPQVVYARLEGLTGTDVSLDGRRLVYTGGHRPTNLRLVELVPRARAIRSRLLTKGTARSTSPAFSPSGEQIAFVRQTERGSGIYLTTPIGDQERLVLQSPDVATCPAFSPDGRRLAFTSVVADTLRVMVADIATGLARAVGQGMCPTWLSDRRLVATQSPAGDFALVVLDLEVGSQATVRPPDSTGDLEGVFLVVAAPGGREVIVDGGVKGGLRRVGLEDGSHAPVTDHDGDWPLSVGPDGWLYFARYPAGSGEPVRLFRTRPSGGPAQFFAELPPECSGESFIALSPAATVAVCEESPFASDVHVVDNFDPETARRR